MQKSIKFNQKLTLAGLLASLVLLAPATAVFSQAQAAEYNHFTSDNWRWEVRRGAGYDYKIQRWLPAGTPIKVLETGDADWSLVEYKVDGQSLTGWIHKNAIQNEAPAKTKLEAALKRLAATEQKFKKTDTSHQELQVAFNEINKENEQLKREKYELTQEYEHLKSISSQSIELDNQNIEMRSLINDLESQNTILKQQAAQAEDAEKRQWFLFGAGVLLLGLFVGRLFRMPKRRGSWNNI